MRMLVIVALVTLLVAPVFAHVTVAPQQSPSGATQVYKVRVHNDAKVPTASIMLQVPDGVEVAGVEKMATGSFDIVKTGDRVSAITWTIAIPVGKSVELAFNAKNLSSGNQLNWNVTENFTDGSTIEFTDKPGAKEKSSVTKLTSASTAAPSAK
jgi:uncharacterized protein YcnI